MKRRMIAVIIGTFLAAVFLSPAQAAPPGGKPQLPIQVGIAPVQPGVSAKTLRPGDVADLAVTATAMTAADEMRIELKLQGGAQLVAGSLSWSGPAEKGEQKQLLISVRVPDQGAGRVKATVTLIRGGKKVMKRSFQYVLSEDASEEEREPAGKPRKDSRGRDIIEY